MFDYLTTTFYAYRTSFFLQKNQDLTYLWLLNIANFWSLTNFLDKAKFGTHKRLFQFFCFVKQFFQSFATLKSVKKCCISILPKMRSKKLNQPLRILQTEKHKLAETILFDFENSSYCSSDNDTGRRDLLLTIRAMIRSTCCDNATSIEFNYATSFAWHVYGRHVKCLSNCRMPLRTDSCHKCFPSTELSMQESTEGKPKTCQTELVDLSDTHFGICNRQSLLLAVSHSFKNNKKIIQCCVFKVGQYIMQTLTYFSIEFEFYNNSLFAKTDKNQFWLWQIHWQNKHDQT